MPISKKMSVQLDQYLHEHADQKLKELLSSFSLEEIVLVINSFSRGKKKLFRLLNAEIAAEVFLHLNEYSRHTIQKILTKPQIKSLIDQMHSDDIVDFIKSFPEYRLQHLLDIIPLDILPQVKRLLRYPEDTAGGLMQTELIALPKSMTIEQSIEAVRKSKDKIDGVHNVFVVNQKNQLIGSLKLEELIFANPKKTLGQVMDKNPLKVSLKMDQEKIARIFREHDIISLPVINSRNVLMGCIMVDDIIDVIEQEHSEDMYRMAGVQSEEHIHDPAFLSAKRRIPWLLVNLATAFLAASVVNLFQNTIQQIVLLAVYMPVVAGMGGNAATQTITIVVRGIALGELNFAETKSVLFKEFLVGFLNGIVIGIIVGLIAAFFNQNPKLGLVIGLAMIFNLIVAGLSGSLIPLTLKKMKIDPALASSIFVTTCTDIFGFFTFLGLATLIML